MIDKKRGMSAVITTLIIILLVIVALGIIWIVIRNVIQGSVEQVELAQKCRTINLEAKKMEDKGGGTSYDITLTYQGTGDEIAGVKITLFNTTDDTNSNLLDFTDNMKPLETQTMNSMPLTEAVIAANQIEMTPYFLNEVGEEEICPTSTTQTF